MGVKTMSENCCRTRINCTCLAVVASVIVGIVTAFLTITATITVTPAFLWVLFGIAVGALAIVFYTVLSNRAIRKHCICEGITALLLGILGTILTSVILLAITFAATSIVGAIITGLLLFFFSLIVTVAACIIRCNANCYED